MGEFWKTDIGKILTYGIHEHNSGLGLINNKVNFILKAINSGRLKLEGDSEDKEICHQYLRDIKEHKTKCRHAMDYVYENIKSDYMEAENKLKEYIDKNSGV